MSKNWLASTAVIFIPIAIVASFAPAGMADFRAFRAGEELHYKIKWGLVTAGRAVMGVYGPRKFRGVNCLIFRSRAQSTGALGFLYPVSDDITSYWDPDKKRSLFHTKRQRENNFRRIYRVLFNYRRRRAVWRENKSTKKNPKWRRTGGVTQFTAPRVQDMLSAIYFHRSHSARGVPGMSFSTEVFDDGRLTRLVMRILRREEISLEINGRTRRFRALVVRPYMKTSGLFKSDGKVLLWISDDNRRWPLKIRAKVPVGNVTVLLHKTRGVTKLKND